MTITSRNKYALMAVFDLANAWTSGERALHLQQIAEHHHIPSGYLLQIMRPLCTAGIVYSARGSKGGYRLTQPPSQTSIGDVIRAIEGANAWRTQPHQPPLPSPLHEVLEGALRDMMDVLNKKTFADLIPQN